MSIKEIVERNDTPSGRIFDLIVQALILLSIVTFSIETLPNLESNTRKILGIAETILVIIFTLEYLLRIYVADVKLKYIFSFYGIIDLCAILPFYVLSGVDLRSLRIFRLLRLFRLMKLLRYNKAMQRLACKSF